MLAMYTSKHRLQAQLWFSLHYLVDEGCLPTYDSWKSQAIATYSVHAKKNY